MDEDRRWPARPTIYSDRQFRSRLEAKWAAFFDLLGWRWEYEPERFGGWMPDFLIFGPNGRLYVEVKPDHLALGAEAKVARAVGTLGRSRFGLVVGEAPWFEDHHPWIGRAYGELDTGEYQDPWPLSWGMAHLVVERRGHALPFDILAQSVNDDCMLAHGNETSGGVVACDEALLKTLWAKATNIVMWRP